MLSGITRTPCLPPNAAVRIYNARARSPNCRLIKFDLRFIKRSRNRTGDPRHTECAQLSNRRDLFGPRTCFARVIKFYNAVKL